MALELIHSQSNRGDMMKQKIAVFALSLLAVAVSANASGVDATVNGRGSAQYDVVLAKDAAIKVDGVLDETVWSAVPEISGSFNYPWEAVQAPKTTFKAFHNGKSLYFSFAVEDKAVLLEDQWKADESSVDNEDRVEMFFAGGSVDQPDNYKLPTYYAVEVDAKGRVHDYSAVYYRHLDSAWNLKGLTTAGAKTDKGYTVEGMIPLASLRDLKLIRADKTARVGLFRAEFSKADAEKIHMQWISWVDPNTSYPDFHVDSAFGVFRFLGL